MVYLVRHGQTESNALGRYAGYSTEPLTESGRGQMRALGSRLRDAGIGEIWTSEVARARESAELLGDVLGVPLKAEPRINEIRMGPWEGLREPEVAQQFPEEFALWRSLPDRLVLEGRETLADLAGRVVPALEEARELVRPVLLVTHVAPIRVAVLAALGLPLSEYKRVSVRNGEALAVGGGTGEAWRLGESRPLGEELRRQHAERSLA